VKNEIEKYIHQQIRELGTICFPLIDSENVINAGIIATKVESLGASAVLIGGSSVVDQIDLAKIVSDIKINVKIPVILFPGNITGVVPKADAILFSSLLNSENPYFITEAQALGSMSVKRYNIEPLPTGYLIIGEYTTAWYVGKARGIPFDKNNLAVMYSLAAQYLGMRFLYLEAGSGSTRTVSCEMIAAVRKYYEGVIIVGGGIHNAQTAKEIADAGADIIVIGTMLEKEDWEQKFSSIINSLRR
jgi:phosphoglycerol geranylgeranyltransferase